MTGPSRSSLIEPAAWALLRLFALTRPSSAHVSQHKLMRPRVIYDPNLITDASDPARNRDNRYRQKWDATRVAGVEVTL